MHLLQETLIAFSVLKSDTTSSKPLSFLLQSLNGNIVIKVLKVLNPICSCGLDIESTSHFLLHCPTFNDERYTLLSTLNNIDPTLLELTKSSLSQTLLYGNTLFDKEKNTRILNATIEYILSTERFEEPLI